MYQTDHIVLAAPDLDAAKAEFEAQTGVLAVDGGPHLGIGTRNALVGVDDHCYIEIIAPDPGQPAADNFGARLARLPAMTLLHWAICATDLPAMAAKARTLGLETPPIRHMSRKRGDGVLLSWSTLGVRGHDLGGLAPFYIDWGTAPHPSQSAPKVRAARFEVTLPLGPVAELLTSAPTGVVIRHGTPGTRLTVTGPRGETQFENSRPQGFSF